MNRIREIRCAAGMTLNQLSKAAHVDQSSLSKYELGKVKPTGGALARIAAVLNVDVKDLTPDAPAEIPKETKPQKPKTQTTRWYTVEEKAPTVPCLVANKNGLFLITSRIIAVNDGTQVLYFNGVHGLRVEDIKPELAISLWLPIPEVQA